MKKCNSLGVYTRFAVQKKKKKKKKKEKVTTVSQFSGLSYEK